MRKLFFKIFIINLIFLSQISAYSAVMEGGVMKTGMGNSSRVVDSATNMPIKGAKVSLPKFDYITVTDDNGAFKLNANMKSPTIMSVQKDGYRPFSLTIDEKIATKPMVVGIEKSNVQDVVISSEMFHLGDDNYSENSANSSEFKGKSIGPFFSKTFMIASNALTKTNYLVIGSIIGIDTLMAKSLNQNSITHAFSSPPEVFFNGRKIAEIQLNGDGQRIKIPNKLLKVGQMNEITIHTGRNLKQTAYIDYDDIEFMNLSIQSE